MPFDVAATLSITVFHDCISQEPHGSKGTSIPGLHAYMVDFTSLVVSSQSWPLQRLQSGA